MDRKEKLRARIKILHEELVTLMRFPEDEFPDGTVLRWNKTFPPEDDSPFDGPVEDVGVPTGPIYTYAALKAGGMWYVTGREGRGRSNWEDLCAFMAAGLVGEIEVMGSAGTLMVA